MQRVFRNKTLLTKRRASSRHSRSAKGQISSKHAGELKIFSGENLRKDLPNTMTATRSCTLRSLFAHWSWQQTKSTIFPLVFWTHTQCTERLIVFVGSSPDLSCSSCSRSIAQGDATLFYGNKVSVNLRISLTVQVLDKKHGGSE